MKVYNVNTKKVLLYGAASRGNIVHEILVKKGFVVEAFIDLRAEEIKSYCGLPVYSLEQASECITDKDEYLVYIDLKNVFEHDAVAIDLHRIGFFNLVFRPGRVLLGTGNEDEVHLNHVYDLLVEENMENSFEVVSIDEVRFPEIKDFSYMAKAGDGYCIVKIPTPIVYTDLEKLTSKWEDINIYGLYPHIQLFEGLSGRNDRGIGTYIAMCENAARVKNVATTDAWRMSLLKNRSEVHDRMQISYDYDFGFFERNAVEAKWNDNGYFNICSGKHRCTFLIAKGMDYVILKVKESDYQKYLRAEQTKVIEDYIVENKLLKLKAPIEHPMFVKYPCANYQYYYGCIKLVTMTMFEVLFDHWNQTSLDGIRIYLDVMDGGFLKRHFLRMGTTVDCANEESALEEVLDSLFVLRMDKIRAQEKANSTEYDFAVIDNTQANQKESWDKKFIKQAIIIDYAENVNLSENEICLGNLCRDGKLLSFKLVCNHELA